MFSLIKWRQERRGNILCWCNDKIPNVDQYYSQSSRNRMCFIMTADLASQSIYCLQSHRLHTVLLRWQCASLINKWLISNIHFVQLLRLFTWLKSLWRVDYSSFLMMIENNSSLCIIGHYFSIRSFYFSSFNPELVRESMSWITSLIEYISTTPFGLHKIKGNLLSFQRALLFLFWHQEKCSQHEKLRVSIDSCSEMLIYTSFYITR